MGKHEAVITKLVLGCGQVPAEPTMAVRVGPLRVFVVSVFLLLAWSQHVRVRTPDQSHATIERCQQH